MTRLKDTYSLYDNVVCQLLMYRLWWFMRSVYSVHWLYREEFTL